MPELADEKYNIASLLMAIDVFTLEGLKEKLRVKQLSSAVLTTIDDLLTREYIRIAEGEALEFNIETSHFDKKPVIAYEVVPDKHEAFRLYIEELNKQRFQPDTQGRPRGPHYRVIEELLDDVIDHPETLAQQETTLEAYFELVQEDEIIEQANLRQKGISEAYVRMLYGRFMEMKVLWEEALLQLLTASYLFHIHGLEELRIHTQGRACEIFEMQYQLAQNNNRLHAFVLSIMEIEQTIPHDNMQTFFFFSLAETTLKEIAAKEQRKQALASVTRIAPKSAIRQISSGIHYTNEEYYTSEKINDITQLANRHIQFVDNAITDREALVNRKTEEYLTKIVTNEGSKHNLGLDHSVEGMKELVSKLRVYFFPGRTSTQNQFERGGHAG